MFNARLLNLIALFWVCFFCACTHDSSIVQPPVDGDGLYGVVRKTYFHRDSPIKVTMIDVYFAKKQAVHSTFDLTLGLKVIGDIAFDSIRISSDSKSITVIGSPEIYEAHPILPDQVNAESFTGLEASIDTICIGSPFSNNTLIDGTVFKEIQFVLNGASLVLNAFGSGGKQQLSASAQKEETESETIFHASGIGDFRIRLLEPSSSDSQQFYTQASGGQWSGVTNLYCHLNRTAPSVPQKDEAPGPPSVSGATSVENPDGTATVTISGTGFVAGVAVTVNGYVCGDVNVLSSTQLTCVLPSISIALTNIVVTAQSSGGNQNIVSAGTSTTCRVKAGAAECWGNNANGQLGNATTTDSLIPVQVQGLTSGATSIACGGLGACAAVNGSAKCWGIGSSLGANTNTTSLVPVQVQGLTSGVTLLSAQFGALAASMFAVSSGSAKAWGTNSEGQLGDGTTNASLIPVQVQGLTTGVSVISGSNASSCAVVSGSAKCWGDNSMGQLGNGTTTTSLSPVQVQGLTSGVTAISIYSDVSFFNYGYGCAVVSGSAKCWGSNGFGQLGNNSTTASLVPVQVQGLTSGVTAISTSLWHACAIVSGSAKCWGVNGLGQLGNNSTTASLIPVQVQGLTSGVTSISAGNVYSCAIMNGNTWCWGSNTYGQLGNGTTADSLLPVLVP